MIDFNYLSFKCPVHSTTTYIAQFTNKSQVYLNKIDDVTGYRAILIAYDDYYEFLNVELEDNFQMLLEQLPEEQRKSFELSQKKWRFFQKNEAEFIQNQWAKVNYGSASSISRGSYKCEIVKARLIQILHYRKGI